MTLIDKTIYPVIPNDLPLKVVSQHYSLSKDELEFTVNKTLNIHTQICFAILFKTYQKLGYFIDVHKCPKNIVTHISTFLKEKTLTDYDLFCYDKDRMKDKHMAQVRQYFKCAITTSKIASTVAFKIAATKSSLIDVINGTIEELLATLHELPDFVTLEKICAKARRITNAGYYELIYKKVSMENKKYIKDKILIYGVKGESNWSLLKQEPPKISIINIKYFSKHLMWLKEANISPILFEDIPQVKLNSLYEEGYSYNFYKIKRLKQEKRISLIAIVIHQQLLSATDDLIYMLIKYINDMEREAREDLNEYMMNKLDQAELLINKFKDILYDYKKGKCTEKLKTMTVSEIDSLIQSCDEYNAYAKHKHIYFFNKRYVKSRQIILSCVTMLTVDSKSPGVDTLKMLKYLNKTNDKNNEPIDLDDSTFNIKWLPSRWRSFCKIKGNKIDKLKFELFVIISLVQGLKNREIFISQSRDYTDYKNELITWTDYRSKIKEYSRVVNLPREPANFVLHIKHELKKNFDLANDLLDVKENATVKDGKLVLRKIVGKSKPKYYKALDSLLDEKMVQINLLDIVATITKRLGLHDYFDRASGHAVRMNEHLKQVVATLFCYGCNLSVREGERSIVDVDRNQIGRINAEHISEVSLNKCIKKVVEVYSKFILPTLWGDGKHVSVDGTKWNIYSKNLMAQYHIRYRGYGGIAYYHVSNTYIALFSNFITCGVYEGRYLLDGIEETNLYNKPEYVHGDTHSQSFVIFALAYLLGIKIMPRIKRLQDLTLYKPGKNDKFDVIDSLFTGCAINWERIINHTEEMFRVALSVKEGKVKPSAFLNKIAYCGGRNNLYLAFRELGRALRTAYILKYISDFDLRKEVHAATCKSEEFNEYVDWISFASDTIKSNHRVKQRKFIKYNHLVTNMVLLYTVEEMSRVIKLAPEHGIEVSEDLLRFFSPYRKEHIIRLGKYEMNIEEPDEVEWNFSIKYGKPNLVNS
ncbi:MAG: transposase, TnpA family [Francisellaceae bacterium]|nr:transposase, TnpA family [Francisellaceae bacterium]